MPISLINGTLALFAHVPKTGGSSIEQHLAAHGPLLLKGDRAGTGLRCAPQHLHAAALRAFVDPAACDVAFLVVRHPVARIVSEYRYQTRKPGWLRDRLSFAQWLAYALARRRANPWYRDNHFRPQVEFLLPGAQVYRFEDGVDACLASVCAQLGIAPPATSIREKTSPRRAVVLTARDLDRIATTYAADFERFGYLTTPEGLAAAGLPREMFP